MTRPEVEKALFKWPSFWATDVTAKPSRRGPNELGIPYRVELDLKIREIPVSRIIHGHMKPQDSQKVERKIRLLAKLIVHPLF